MMEQGPDVLGKLKGVRRCGDGWIARCPAHEDRRPSLSVSVRDGKLLLHCHAGCTFGAIRAALGGTSRIGLIGDTAVAEMKYTRRTTRSAAEWNAIADRAIRDGKQRGTTMRLASNLGLPVDALKRFGVGWSSKEAYTIPMRNASGEIVGIQLRKPSGKRFCIAGSRLGLFLPSYPTPQSRMTPYMAICEGMSDAAAATAMGFAAIGRPSATGGTSLIEQYTGQECITYTIIADNDEVGIVGAWKLIKRLSRAQPPIPYRLIWPPWPHKDLRAWYAADPSGASQALGKYLT